MYFFGQDFEELCESNCRQYKVYTDVYAKGELGYSDTPYMSFEEKDGIVSIKIVKGQTSGSFSYGGAFSGQLTLVLLTKNGNIPASGDKITISISFVSGDGVETEQKAPLGSFFVEGTIVGEFSATVTATDGIAKLGKYYIPNEAEYPMTTETLFNKIAEAADVIGVNAFNDRVFKLNEPTITKPPLKAEDAEEEADKYYTYREIAGMIASINAGNAFVDAYNSLKISTPDFYLKREIPAKSVISYTDKNATNRFSTTFWKQTYTGDGVPPEIDPQSEKYDPTIMIVDFPLETDSDYKDMQANIDNQISGISYDGVIIKKQGTGRQEIGDLLAFTDPFTGSDGKAFNNVLVMGIVYEISAKNGFRETLYSISQSEAQQQSKGLSTNTRVERLENKSKISGGGGGVGEFTNEAKTSEIFNCYSDVKNESGSVMAKKNYINPKASYSHVAGKSNAIDKNVAEGSQSSEYASICGGAYNYIKNAQGSAIVCGNGNSIYNSSNGNHASFAIIGAGSGNSIKGSARASILNGDGNTIDGAIGSTILTGIKNIISAVLNGMYSVIVAGYGCTIKDAQGSTIVCGQFNGIVDASNVSIISGENNSIERAYNSAIVTGHSNSISDTNNQSNGILCGEYQHIQDYSSKSAIICGNDNSILNSNKSCVLSGSKNSIRNTLGSVIFGGKNNSIGEKNNLPDTYSTAVYGETNITNFCNNTIIFGTANTVDGVNDSLIVGKGHKIDPTVYAKSGRLFCGQYGTFETQELLGEPIPMFAVGGGTSSDDLKNVAYIDEQGNVYAKSFNVIGAEAAAASVVSEETAAKTVDISALAAQINQMQAEIEALKAEIAQLKGETN